ncbi:MAG TPA: energy transducer TonB [Dyella sp.]|uniref:energy transducer TonB n=1 Tax=Dyella sp. TaxID=1869338 RepID=UPI002CF09CAA|nr:energy transducer TonB [Dyella sp.]HTV85377.1 energy transducer TonB [Dyella sp.]
MYRRDLVFCAVFPLLTSCAQTPQKANGSATQAADAANSQQLVIKYMAHQSPTHPAAQDITYNSHYPPHFPVEAFRAGHYGMVTLLIYVSAKGEVGDIRVETSSGYPELDASAVDAAKHWVFMPAAKDGVPQPGWVRTPVSFNRPVPPPRSPDGLQVGVVTESDARALMGEPSGTMRYTNGMTQMIWGSRNVGMVVLIFDATGMLTKVYKSMPPSKS